MNDGARRSPFRILLDTFLEQFVANESATSDLQTRRAIIGAVTFLLTPGLFLMMQTFSTYDLVVKVARFRNMPEMIETHLLQLAILFVSYSIITTGLVTVFIWDTLVFDKRDAMLLGPLPIRGRTIVGAKLAALATVLIGTALAVNLISGAPFGLVTGAPAGRVLRHFLGHFSGTVGGAIFIFSSLVVVRGLLLLVVRPQFAATLGGFLQFAFLSGVLCFMMIPSATGTAVAPISWFVGLFEYIRGGRSPGIELLAQRAMVALPCAVGAAIAITAIGYQKQMRLALAPSARVAASARLRRSLAALMDGRDRIARGTSDFILTTLVRSRVQQVPIATAAALGVAIASLAIATRPGGIENLQTPRTAVLWVPIVVGYWIVVGLRASFVMPTELSAAWAFRAHARLPTASYWVGVRAAMIAFVIGPALFVNALVVLPLLGVGIAAIHSLVVLMAVTITAQFASLMVDSVPFTRPYPPGHAKLKTRWPLYLLGLYLVAYAPVQMELRALHDTSQLLWLFGEGAALIVLLELLGRRRALAWTLPDTEADADPEALTFLNIGPDVTHARLQN
jgi:hypothetical protein